MNLSKPICTILLVLSPFTFHATAASNFKVRLSPEVDPKVVLSTYSRKLVLLPRKDDDPAMTAKFEGKITVSGLLWVEKLDRDGYGDSGWYLIPDKKSAKLLPRVTGDKFSYPLSIQKILLRNPYGIPIDPLLKDEERSRQLKENRYKWEMETLTKLVGSAKTNELFNLKPEVLKIKVIATIEKFGTSVDCDHRGYGARFIDIRIPKIPPKDLVAMGSQTRFEGC